jgi:manganese catalase
MARMTAHQKSLQPCNVGAAIPCDGDNRCRKINNKGITDMFYHDGGKLQYPVRVTNPNPIFAKALQQAIGGVQGEIRVCLQYLFQAWGARGPAKYRDMLLETGTEEIAHIEMLSTAVALNLEGSPTSMEEAAKDPIIAAKLGGMEIQHLLSTCMAAMPVDADGVPFNCSHVYASGNIAADMLSNVTAESTGRMLAVQLYRMTDDPGMKDMLRYLIARDTMHQNQWLAAWEELGGAKNHPIPNDFPQEEELTDVSYSFFTFGRDNSVPAPEGRWSSGDSIDGKGTFKLEKLEPQGEKPALKPSPDAAIQSEQLQGMDALLNKIMP